MLSRSTLVSSLTLAFTLALTLALGAVARADKAAPTEGAPAEPRMDPKKAAEMQKAMEAWSRFAAPGPEHARFKEMAGSYTTTVKMWMDPSSPPQESNGTAEFKTILGDRFCEQTFTGTFMGQPFNGMGVVGYDNVRKKYSAIWMDTTATGTYAGEGTADKAGNITYQMTSTDPVSGKPHKSRDIWRKVDDTTFVYETFMTPPKGGKEFKMMEITYKRK